MDNSAARLRAIKTFEELTRYLEDALDWPLEEYGFDDLTFEYSPAELGLKDEDAAKIKTIHQLRPLWHGQPWGIFFVEFEKKRMPVVVLRRILSHLVLKKRAAANKPQSAAWHLDDLLFVSAFGDAASDQREIAFAHFHQETGDLPTLRVLGWDGADTGLKLDHVATMLSERLRWPANPGDIEAWRQQWSRAFKHRVGHVIRTADALADRLAILARGIRDAAHTIMVHEAATGPLRRLYKAFQTSLIHDLSEEHFADTYAQTITYGLLTAAISRTEMSEGRHGTNLIADNVTDMVPITNPFLREMLQTFLQAGGQRGGINFDELGIQDVVELLRGDETDLPAILRDFGNRTRGEDPVIHFYEHFLGAYNKQLKVQRGVFYTPQAVVSYIVRSVHELLQSEFDIEDGLASTITWDEMVRHHQGLKIPSGVKPDSPFVQILDPATGTATFLVEVIDVIYRTLTAKWKQQRLTETQQRDAWNDYVPKHLLPRLHGYELMMAPYAIAHMKIGLKLHETGYRFGSDERARIYLTNALEPASDSNQQLRLDFDVPALAHEAQAVDAIKHHQRFTVIIGNPPYSVSTQNRGIWVNTLIESYKEGLNEKKHTLDDDYVKFVALGQRCCDTSGAGILGFITNHGYLKNPTFRGMRQSLLQSFSMLRVFDLHGNLRQKEAQQDLEADENVFDIQQGVVITLGVRANPNVSIVNSDFADIWGVRAEKYRILNTSNIGTTKWHHLSPHAPFFLLVPQDEMLREEFEQWPSLTEVFINYGSGIKTDRDELCTDSNKNELAVRMKLLFSGKYDHDFVELYNIHPSSSYNVVELAARTKFSDADLIQCLYRPFDVRWLYYKRGFTSRPAYEVIKHMISGRNIGLLSARTNKSGKMDHFFCSQLPTEVKVAESTTQSCLFPLYLADNMANLHLYDDRVPNLSKSFLALLSKLLHLPQPGLSLLPQGLTPENIFNYAYAVFYSPSYRSRYAEFLKIDFPRLPLTGSLELFRTLARIGGELVALHLTESSELDRYVSTYTGLPQPMVEKISYDHNTVWLDKAQTRGFRSVPEAVWNFHIGGYQVCQKWLKDRKGRVLSKEDIEHYHRIVVALHETIGLMQKIDEVIEEHGGWPGAFTAT